MIAEQVFEDLCKDLLHKSYWSLLYFYYKKQQSEDGLK